LYKFEIFDIQNNCFQKTGPPKPIRDLQYTEDTIFVPDTGTVLDVNVKLINIQHPWDSDLDIYLLKSGRSSELSTDNGGSGDNYINCILNDSATTSITMATAPMTGTWKPETPLNVFNFNTPYGDWMLRIYDDSPGDEGTLVDWCVEIIYNTYVGIEKTITIPNKFSLYQNFPNPFNPITKIQYSIAKRSYVHLKIYDVLGRKIKTIVNEMKQPGVYIVDFNGANLPSGVYFYRLEAKSETWQVEDFIETKKMLLIK
jgi:subtilisin-like proprotein convertase family protein